MLYILKHIDIFIILVLKIKSVSDEKVKANQDRVYFQHLHLFLTTKNSLFTSDIHWKV